jgi:hypothetical protein
VFKKHVREKWLWGKTISLGKGRVAFSLARVAGIGLVAARQFGSRVVRSRTRSGVEDRGSTCSFALVLNAETSLLERFKTIDLHGIERNYRSLRIASIQLGAA